ncbi:uncharacterized protein SPSK_05761 [Sporothrix schenckii 1099-18]|uniref:Uncharacterized protein n=1 Tax=Sporothrix schenckii 1099-18 TaxID=1397361 RepID=A0A0F2LUI6_SPOSC|nr:uncharacterized protein SPSK_05761 [Sporothrix schenckii 1099-18]KJR80494.1 hypothetical protein SPSK_05761 [Sporothrix schenckii 1099-18]
MARHACKPRERLLAELELGGSAKPTWLCRSQGTRWRAVGRAVDGCGIARKQVRSSYFEDTDRLSAGAAPLPKMGSLGP